MTHRIDTPSPSDWDAFVRAHPRGHILQMSEWGAHRAAFGWRDERVAVTAATDEARILGGALLLFRPLPARLGTMAYLAMAPLIHPDYARDPQVESALWRGIDTAARRHRAVFIKWEPGVFIDGKPGVFIDGKPGIYAADEPTPDPIARGFRPSDAPIQPPNTVLIDLDGDDEHILARMNQGTRRKIRQSLKDTVIYSEASPADLPRFTALMQATGQRNDFGTYDAGYYVGMYQRFAPRDAALILAQHDGEALAGVMVFAVGARAWYLYGASSDSKRNLMASYGAQWSAIQWARARGCALYDMWGIPDAPPEQLEAEFETRSDGLWGVYGFKRGWGGRIVRSLGAWERVYNPLVYALYQMAVQRRERRNRNSE